MTHDKPNAELLDAIEGFVRDLITGLDDPPATRRGRPRVLPALALWAGMLVCVARGFSSQLELWRLLTASGLWHFPQFSLSDDTIYKRLKQLGPETFHACFDQVTRVLRARHSAPLGPPLAPWAAGVFALDEMTLDAIKKRLPSVREVAETVLPGKVIALFDVRQQRWQALRVQPDVHQNEKVGARAMLADVPVGSLLLADLGYFAFAWFDDLTREGYAWISRLRAKTSYTVIHTFYQGEGMRDALVWLGAYRADRARQAVRLVSFTRGDKTWSYLTNVLEPTQLSLAQISALYARRWDIEMMFHLVKTHLHLHVLWSSHVNVVLHQVYAVFTVAQIILGLRADIAQQAQAEVAEVSLDLLIRWLPRFAQQGDDPVQKIVERGRFVRIIRPSTRLVVHTPDPPPTAYAPRPADVVLTRTPRYAHKA